MSDDFGDRTQKPTERRRREARARGEVARSADLVAASVLLVTMAALWWLGPQLADVLARAMRDGLSSAPRSPVTAETVAQTITLLTTRLAVGVVPLLLIATAAAALGSLVQTGFLWTPAALMPKLERLDLAKGFGRWVSLNSWVSLGAGLVKLTVLMAVLIAFVRVRLPSAGPLTQGEPAELLGFAARTLVELGLLLALSLFVLALLDYGWQFWRHEQSLMMTVEELRREQREDSTDPRMRRARSELATEAVSPVTGPR
ncbi:MAG: EscU/YscU/HrcU family type III secretion system export apparatus switch protein [Planctomycetota bacterium]